MPGGWSKQRDVRKLSETRAAFEWAIPVAELPGISSDVSATDGLVHARLRFDEEQGLAVVRIALRAQLQLVCQRCMQRVELPLDADSAVAMVQTESDADAVPLGWETYLAPEGRLNLAALVAEELLLALPIVPLHAIEVGCAADAANTATPAQAAAGTRSRVSGKDDGAEQASVRPFADLRALLDGGADSK